MTKHKTPIISWIFRVVLLFFISLEIWNHPQLSNEMKAVFIIGIFVLNFNDHWRNRKQFIEKNRFIYYLSIIISICGIGFYMIKFDCTAVDIYYLFPVVEIFLYIKRTQIVLLILHVLVFLYAMEALKAGIQQALFPYLAMLGLIYLFRSNSLEKEKAHLLNAELMEANAKLKEITIVKERTRIAQELHDSIGHGLIALKMHLEFAGNMIDADPAKSKKVLKKALRISQQSITDLRKAVDVLKENDTWKNHIKLQESLQDLIQSLQTVERLKFKLEFDKTVEYTSQDVQNGIYNTVREAITNGLKHGRAEFFQIEIAVSNHKIKVSVKDDGEGCSDIIKSHGLRGIEERIRLLKGDVHFSSTKGSGFIVNAEIPFMASAG